MKSKMHTFLALLRVLKKSDRILKKTKRQESSRSITFKSNYKTRYQEVCKEEFLSIHGLQANMRRVYNVCRQIRDGLNTPKSDGRGRHNNRKNKLPAEMVQSVYDHIQCIPKYCSHYIRKKIQIEVILTTIFQYHLYIRNITLHVAMNATLLL